MCRPNIRKVTIIIKTQNKNVESKKIFDYKVFTSLLIDNSGTQIQGEESTTLSLTYKKRRELFKKL